MLLFCPHCGHQLKKPLRLGISYCHTCERAFDTSPRYRLLSASWQVRHWNLYDPLVLTSKGFSQFEAEFAVNKVHYDALSPEEIEILVKGLNLSEDVIDAC